MNLFPDFDSNRDYVIHLGQLSLPSGTEMYMVRTIYLLASGLAIVERVWILRILTC